MAALPPAYYANDGMEKGEDAPLLSSNLWASEERKRDLGEKTIGYWGSIALCVNNLMGPGALALPVLFLHAGYIMPAVLVMVLLVVSSFASTILCEAVALIPGNRKFGLRIEYSTLVEHFFGRRWYYVCQIALCTALTALNIASVVVAAESMDQVIRFVFGYSLALEYFPSLSIVQSTAEAEMFGAHTGFISVGYVLLAILCIPLGYQNLNENVKIQLISFVATIGILFVFIVSFLLRPLHVEATPAVGERTHKVLGTVMFSYAAVMTIPSWVNEKAEHVSINAVVWSSTAISSFLYIVIGLLGAWAYPHLHEANILDVLARPDSPLADQLSAFSFSLLTVAPGISLYSIMVRYNLYVGQICGYHASAFWGVLFPWLTGFIFMRGKFFIDLMNWTSLIIIGVTNFVLPFVVYVRARQECCEKKGKPFQIDNEAEEDLEQTEVNAIPTWLSRSPVKFTVFLLTIAASLIVLAFSENIVVLMEGIFHDIAKAEHGKAHTHSVG